jgi:DNA-binding GntR family transcriptional regulator
MAPQTGKAEAVYRRLKADIESVALAPGERLSEVALGERLGASRTPVREAIRRLTADGLVTIAPGEVARVAPISLSDTRMLFEFRLVLEPAAVRMITADAGGNPELLEVFIRLLRALRSVSDRAANGDAGVVEEFYNLAEDFDQEVIRLCHNSRLSAAIAAQRGLTARLRSVSHADPNRFASSLAEHIAICESIVGGDADEAAKRAAEHLHSSLRTILEGLLRGSAGLPDISLDALNAS